MRGNLSFEGIKEHYTTFRLATGITVADEGKAVKITDNETVGFGDGLLLGKLAKVEFDGYGSVQDGGYAKFEYAAIGEDVIPEAEKSVTANSTGKVVASDDYAGNQVISVDETTETCWVYLG